MLEKAALRLKRAWNTDQQNPKSYPMNTSWILGQIKEALEDKHRVPTGGKLLRVPRTPKNLSDLVEDELISVVYEDHNQGTYEDALSHAAHGFRGSQKWWRKILRAVETAYFIEYFGAEFAPMPKVHFLHRNLLKLLESEPLRGLTREGILEFLDDMCPCGKKHTLEAIRKLEERRTKHKRKKDLRDRSQG